MPLQQSCNRFLMKKLLFVSHDASRTGAPIVLLSFLNWLKQQKGYEITVYLRQGGELQNDFTQLAKTYLPPKENFAQKIVKRIFKQDKNEKRQIPVGLLAQHFDLIYLNTIACLDIAPLFKANFKCPVICHIHENEFTINNHYPEFVAEKNLFAIDRFIAVSKSTKTNFSTTYGVNTDKIDLIYEFVDLNKMKTPFIPKEEIKHQLGLTNEFVVGGSGLTTWRKGIDLFLRLAIEVNKLRPNNNIKLMWVGFITNEFNSQYTYEVQRLGIKDKIIFTGSVPTPQNYFQVFDVFALTSREDPFPLVAIEAASLGKPILCFKEAGGIEEFVEDGETGFIIPYADVTAMANKILELQDNCTRCITMGQKSGNLSSNYDTAKVAPKIVQVIEQILSKS
jgi:glycosyltransferase involved in cell wall biosynthesis